MAITYPGSTTYPGATTFPGDSATVTVPTGPIVAIPHPETSPPSVIVNVTGFGGSIVKLIRNDADGGMRPVRGVEPGTTVAGGLSATDYEAPYNTTFTYTIQSTDGVFSSTSAPVTLTSDLSWLVHPSVPSLSQPANFLTPSTDRNRPSSVTNHQVIGRKSVIPIGDGARKNVTGSATVWTATAAAYDGMESMLSSDSPLLAQIVPLTLAAGKCEWWSLGDVGNPATGTAFEDPYTEWALPYTVVDRPSGVVQSEWTYADILVGYSADQDVFDDFASWLDVLTNNPVI